MPSLKPARSKVLNNTTLKLAAIELANRDKELGDILATYGPPPLWRRPSGFPTLAKIILEQQVSLTSAAAVFERLNRAIQPFQPENVHKLGQEYLRALGLTRQKSAYLVHLSASIVGGNLNLSGLARLTDNKARESLMAVKGIGSWSADVYLLMAMRRADIWPSGDLALAVAVKEIKNLVHRPEPAVLERIADVWRPYRAVAARMLWQYYLARKKKPLIQLAASK